MNTSTKKRQFEDKYRVDTFRLKNWDYGSNGLYFITICTKNRIPYFVTPVEPHDCAAHDCAAHDCATQDCTTQNRTTLVYTEIGKIANQFWSEIRKHFPYVKINEFVIMPDHIHGILMINKPGYLGWKPNAFGPQSKNLGSIVRAYKSSVKRYANQNKIEFEWHSLYHEKVIHSERALNNIRNYIKNNPEVYTVETHNCASSQKRLQRNLNTIIK